MATIINRDGRWQAKIRRDRRTVSKTFASQTEAKKWARAIESQMDRDAWADREAANRLSFGEAVEKWETTILTRLADSTQKADQVRCRLLREDDIAAVAIGKINVSDILDFMDRCEAKGRSSQTVFQYTMIISRVFSAARTEWAMPYLANPVAALPKERKKFLRKPGREARRLVSDEESRLLAACTPQMARVVTFAIATAMRRSEIANLLWKDVHHNERYLIARETKNGDDRNVPLSRAALAVLGAIGRVEDRDKAVFGMTPSAITQAMDDACRRGGIENLRFHDLRHEAISRMSRGGQLTTSRLAAISGHKTLQMLKKYDHATMDELADALDRS